MCATAIRHRIQAGERAAAIAACAIAKVEPAYEMLNGHDPEAFIWSSNAKRRQMTKGQIAMVAAMGHPTEPVGKGLDAGKAKAARAAGVSPQRLSAALLVKMHAPDLARSVIEGTLGLDAAHDQAKVREKEAKWRDDGLKMLRAAAPDLATRVVDEEINVAEARKRLEQRIRDEAAMRGSVF
jgi:hypothetical protein